GIRGHVGRADSVLWAASLCPARYHRVGASEISIRGQRRGNEDQAGVRFILHQASLGGARLCRSIRNGQGHVVRTRRKIAVWDEGNSTSLRRTTQLEKEFDGSHPARKLGHG